MYIIFQCLLCIRSLATSKPKPEQTLGNVGSLVGKKVGKKVGIKSIIWRISGGYHHEIWVDPTGSGTKWQRYGSRNVSSWGVKDKTSQRPRDQQVEFRNDCVGAKCPFYFVIY